MTRSSNAQNQIFHTLILISEINRPQAVCMFDKVFASFSLLKRNNSHQKNKNACQLTCTIYKLTCTVTFEVEETHVN